MTTQVIQQLAESIQAVVLQLPEFFARLVFAALVFFIFRIIAQIISNAISNRLSRHTEDRLMNRFLSRLAGWIVILFGVVAVMNIVGLGEIATSLIAGAGISALIIGFALKDIGENLLSGIALAFKPPFTVGDIIETNGIKGEVQSIDFRTTYIRSLEGRDIYVPNSLILKSILVNHTKHGATRQELQVKINDSSKIDDAIKIIGDKLSAIEGILKEPEISVIIDDYSPKTVNLKAYFWVSYTNTKHDLTTVMSKANREIKATLKESNLLA